MAMVALNAARTKIVDRTSLEARWIVDEDEAERYIADAQKHPKMQALMEGQSARRLEDEKRSAAIQSEIDEHAARKRRQALG